MNLNKLLFNYFNGEVMAQYLPKIIEGFFLTIQLALAVVVTGILAGLILALIRSFRIRWVNPFIVFFVDVLRALPPLVIIIMFYFALPNIGIQMSGFVCHLALPGSRAHRLCGRDLLGRYSGCSQRPVGGGALDRFDLSSDPAVCRAAPGRADHHPTPHQPDHRHHQGHGPGRGRCGGEILYQAQAGLAFSYNPSPLTLGAIAYLILFVPVVSLGRWVETRYAWKR